MLRTHTCGELRKEHAGETVTLSGWVETHRIQGKISFIMLRDRYGKTQCFVNPKITKDIGELRRETVVKVTGEVKERPENQVKAELATGEVELSAQTVEVLAAAEPLPLELDGSSNEDTRLKYRYLDLRRPEMVHAMQKRHEMMLFVRNFLDQEGFFEITTPMLTKSTPEGARDYLVPSRVHKGKFFALPQSPQQYKQLLMVGGMDKYFQIAPCFRDEDARADRCPGEFYQIDMEMSFVEQEDVLDVTERMMIQLVEEVFPDKKITQVPFPRLTHKEAMEQYGSDKPDIRKNKDDVNELGFCWVLDFPLFEEREGNEDFHIGDGNWAPSHHMFTMCREEDIELLDSDPGKVRSYQHDLAMNGFEVGGGSIRIHDAKIQEKIFDLIGFSAEQKQEFAHMLEAFSYGVPPHGGIAPGFDRLLMAILGTPSIRDVVAFPKDKTVKDPVMNAPSVVEKQQLDDLGLQLRK